MKRLVLLALAVVTVALAVLAAPALSTRPWVPQAVDFELAPSAGDAAAAGAVRGRGLVAPPLRTPKRFNLVGFRWTGRGEPAIAIRTRVDGGRWSRWATVPESHDHGPDRGAERTPRGATDPVWVGEADWIQYRMSEPVGGLRLHFVNSTGTATAAARAKTALRQAANRAAMVVATPFVALAQGSAPAMVSRAEWGADRSCRPSGRPSYGEVKAAFVHHTVSTNTYTREEGPSVVLAICRYHRNSNGWSDIGYNFLVDQYGVIYEGRAGGVDRAVVGAQAQGFNAQTTGIAAIGRHDTASTAVAPSQPAIDAIARVIRWKLPVHGQPTAGTVVLTSAGGSANRHPSGAKVRFERISGHRDAGRTACPGEQLYAQLPAIRAQVGEVTPRTARTRLSATIGPRVVRFPQPVRFSGRLTGGGGPVDGAPVEVQALRGRAWRTVKTATTGADGAFETEISPGGTNTLRVRYPGGGSLRASASRRTLVRVRPALSARRSVSRARVGQTPIVSGRIQPRRARVELVVQRREGRRNVTIAKQAVRARGGRFRKGVRVRTPGLYRFYVRFRADKKNLGAVSTPFYIRVEPAGSGGGVQAD